VAAVAAGPRHSLAVATGGRAFGWGFGDETLGLGVPTPPQQQHPPAQRCECTGRGPLGWAVPTMGPAAFGYTYHPQHILGAHPQGWPAAPPPQQPQQRTLLFSAPPTGPVPAARVGGTVVGSRGGGAALGAAGGWAADLGSARPCQLSPAEYPHCLRLATR